MDWTRSFLLLRLLFYWQRLKSALPGRNRLPAVAENLRAGFYERLWRDAAEQLGATFEPLGHGILRIGLGSASTCICDSCTAIDDPVTLAIAGNKPLVYRLLSAAGLPIPRQRAFQLRDLDRAADFSAEMGRDCVVKPAIGTGAGRGVTTGIRSRPQLGRAALAAAQFGPDLLIEEQITGKNYRLLYLDGKLLDAVERRPPALSGDGQATIRQLLAHANRDRLAQGTEFAQALLTIDADLRNTLARQNLSLRSVPSPGERVEVKTVVNQNFGQDNVSVGDALCPSVIADGARASQAIGARLAGVDIITPDPGLPLRQAGGVVLEVNTTPGLHHHCRSPGGAVRMAVTILEALLGRVADAVAGDAQRLPTHE